jgi:hypothetical protein
MKTMFLIFAIAIAMLTFNSCSDESILTDANPELKGAMLDFETCTDSVFNTTIDDLTEADIAGLLWMREEEKLAHDVYVNFYEQYALVIFERIANSENKHAEAVLRLLTHFGLEDPALEEPGVFSHEALQSLYNVLIEAGNDSLVAALQAGALIEETDIADLQALIDETENSDLLTVYGHLLKGSGQHLKAFVKTLQSYGISYEPSVLTPEAFDAIMVMPNGNGQKKQGIQKGKGNGQNNKGGTKGKKGGNGKRGGN